MGVNVFNNIKQWVSGSCPTDRGILLFNLENQESYLEGLKLEFIKKYCNNKPWLYEQKISQYRDNVEQIYQRHLFEIKYYYMNNLKTEDEINEVYMAKIKPYEEFAGLAMNNANWYPFHTVGLNNSINWGLYEIIKNTRLNANSKPFWIVEQYRELVKGKSK